MRGESERNAILEVSRQVRVPSARLPGKDCRGKLPGLQYPNHTLDFTHDSLGHEHACEAGRLQRHVFPGRSI